MERAVQVFAVINFLAIGLSHILAPKAWAQFFILIRDKGHAGVFAVAFLSLWFGSIVAAFHNVWSGVPVVLTVVGWAQVAKALLYFSFPSFGLRRLEGISLERAHVFIYPGVAFVALAGLLGYHLATT